VADALIIANRSTQRQFFRVIATSVADDPIDYELAERTGDVISVALRDELGRPVLGIRDDGGVTLLDGRAFHADLVGDVPDASITNAKLAAGAGVAALVAAGLGNSVSYTNADTGTKTIVTAHATKDRGALVMVHIDETFADGLGTQPTLKIGEDATTNKAADTAVFVDAVAGTTFFFGFKNLATKKIIATLVPAVGVGTGGVSITVLALPNS
jgi:hypothetical protein